jgi:hypothetical protein
MDLDIDNTEPPEMPDLISGVGDYVELRDEHVSRAYQSYRQSRRSQWLGFEPSLAQAREIYRLGVLKLQWECATQPSLADRISSICQRVGAGDRVVGMPGNPLSFIVGPIAEWIVSQTKLSGIKRYCVKLFIEIALTLLIIELFSLLADRVGSVRTPMGRLTMLASEAAGVSE